MAVYTESSHVTRPAGADLSSSQYYIVKLQADSTYSPRSVILASAATDVLMGVIANVPDSGAGSDVDVVTRNASGTFKVICGGTIAIGDALTSDANGKAITTTSSGNHVLGYAQEAGASGQIIEFMPALHKY